jgi:hypothetical protein
MKPDMFEKPILILVGLGFPAEMRGVTDAYRHLCEWPLRLRDNAHAVALKACGAAIRGEVDAETARGLFVAFAEKHDLLVQDTSDRVASKVRLEQDSHVR